MLLFATGKAPTTILTAAQEEPLHITFVRVHTRIKSFIKVPITVNKSKHSFSSISLVAIAAVSYYECTLFSCRLSKWLVFLLFSVTRFFEAGKKYFAVQENV